MSTWRIIPVSKWLITMISYRPLRIGLWDPFHSWPFVSWLINGGMILTTYDTPIPGMSSPFRIHGTGIFTSICHKNQPNISTPPKTNMVHLKMGGPLEKEIPIGNHHFQVLS